MGKQERISADRGIPLSDYVTMLKNFVSKRDSSGEKLSLGNMTRNLRALTWSQSPKVHALAMYDDLLECALQVDSRCILAGKRLENAIEFVDRSSEVLTPSGNKKAEIVLVSAKVRIMLSMLCTVAKDAESREFYLSQATM